MATLTGQAWKERYLGGSLEAETLIFQKYVEDIHLVQAQNLKSSAGQSVRRALHAKIQAGITNAQFKIDPNIPSYLQHGIFQPGKTYDAHVRLSNASGKVQPDTANDLRGLAIRVFSSGENEQTEINDLLMTNAPVSHARNVRQFMEFAKAASKPPTFLLPIRLLFSVGPFETIRMLANVIKYSRRKVGSLATETYWSRGPFQLGSAALQFHAKPVQGTVEVEPGEEDNYLRQELVERLKKGDITFDIMAQLFVSEDKTPIEDGAKMWQEKNSPPLRIAQLIILQQDLGENRDQDEEASVEQTAFNPWNGAKTFRPLGQLNRGRNPVYAASEDYRLKRDVYIPPIPWWLRLIESIFAIVNRFIRWDSLPPWLGVASLEQLRTLLREKNLYDTETEASRANPLPRNTPEEYLTNRSTEGSYNDLSEPDMGRTNRRFGRNMPLDRVQRPSDERIVTPNPRIVAQELMTRESFKPASTLNILAAGWIQFMIHGWFSHTTVNPNKDPKYPYFEIPVAENDNWPEEQNPMRIRRTKVDPTHTDDPKGHPTPYLNRESPWWDGSQIYGRDQDIQSAVRSGKDGKLWVDDKGLLRIGTNQDSNRQTVDGVEITGVSDNWWLGLALMHVLFTLEHNAICDRLKREYPVLKDDELFEKARLINGALMAKIHTVEWTPGILGHPTLQIGMNANWWGLVGENITKALGRISENESISGIPGSLTNHFGVPYSLTEEFVSVYRMHPLVPDHFTFRSVTTNEFLGEATLANSVGVKARDILEEYDLSDLFYSLGIAHPGAITLENYPNFLRNLPRRTDNRVVDLATVDILRDRERGVPRYNDFRELLRLPRIESFDKLTSNSQLAEKIKTVYDNKIDDVDLMVGLFAENPPEGFGFSDTAFRIFILMASRRLNSDRFFTTDYTPQVYTPVGLEWINDNTMITVLLRHYPKLAPALRGVKNAFAPWNRLGS